MEPCPISPESFHECPSRNPLFRLKTPHDLLESSNHDGTSPPGQDRLRFRPSAGDHDLWRSQMARLGGWTKPPAVLIQRALESGINSFNATCIPTAPLREVVGTGAEGLLPANASPLYWRHKVFFPTMAAWRLSRKHILHASDDSRCAAEHDYVISIRSTASTMPTPIEETIESLHVWLSGQGAYTRLLDARLAFRQIASTAL